MLNVETTSTMEGIFKVSWIRLLLFLSSLVLANLERQLRNFLLLVHDGLRKNQTSLSGPLR